MSGHSKWHNIQKTKGAADAKRSAAFTKIAKEIIVAVKQGGSGDPNNNSRLATVIAKAKELGCKKIFLESNTLLRPAIQLYRKAGFREVEIYRPSYERVDIQMELALQ